MTAIIKSGAGGGGGNSVKCAAFNLDDLAEHGERYLAEVRRQAEKILTDAKADADRLRRQAAEQGRAEALAGARQQAAEEAKEELERRVATLVPALTSVVQAIEQSKEGWRAHWEKNAVCLATAIAGRILRREVAATPTVTLTLMREALELAAGATRLVIRLNAADLESLGDDAQTIAAPLAKAAHVEFVADPDVSPGGCRVITEFGEIDQRIESQLARIEEEFNSD